MTARGGGRAGALESLQLGATKVLLDDGALPSLDELVASFAAAHRRRRPVAVHCVTRVQLVLALVAFELAGTVDGDRLEHGSVIPADVVPWLQRSGLGIVTQPNFVAERGDDYLSEVDVADHTDLYRCASLLRAGVPVAAGTDAPFGDPDPWKAIAAATERRTMSGRALGLDERIDASRALGLFIGRPGAPASARRVDVGQPADLCLLFKPLDRALRPPRRDHVRGVLIAGRPIGLSREP